MKRILYHVGFITALFALFVFGVALENRIFYQAREFERINLYKTYLSNADFYLSQCLEQTENSEYIDCTASLREFIDHTFQDGTLILFLANKGRLAQWNREPTGRENYQEIMIEHSFTAKPKLSIYISKAVTPPLKTSVLNGITFSLYSFHEYERAFQKKRPERLMGLC